jgi:hypothetical protein
MTANNEQLSNAVVGSLLAFRNLITITYCVRHEHYGALHLWHYTLEHHGTSPKRAFDGILINMIAPLNALSG